MSNKKKKGCVFYGLVIIAILYAIGTFLNIVSYIASVFPHLNQNEQTLGIIAVIIFIISAVSIIVTEILRRKKMLEQQKILNEHEREVKNAEEIKKLISQPYLKISNIKTNIKKFNISSDHTDYDIQENYINTLNNALSSNTRLLEIIHDSEE